MKKFLQKAVILPLIIIAALAIVIFQVKSRSPVQHKVLTYPIKAVEVFKVNNLPYRSRVTAYGHVEPALILKAKAEVGGKISYVHPSLKQGGSLPKGTIVLRIEPTTYEFSLDQSEAGLAGSQSSLQQLETEEKSNRRSLEIAIKNLNIGRKELERIKNLFEKNLVAQSALDVEDQNVLSLKQKVEDLQGKLATYASRKASTQAQISQSQTQVAQQKDTLGRTEVRLPFDARIGTVSVEEDEFVPAGSQLFEALGTSEIEVTAQIPTKEFRQLIGSIQQDLKNFQDPTDLQKVVSNWKLDARLRLVDDTTQSVWNAKLQLISESIDPTRDTIGLVVSLKNPYRGIIPGKRPPLLKGMYTSVEFFAAPQPMLVIPRKAIHQGRVYVATADNKLSIRPVSIRFVQGSLAVIESGLNVGEKVIITDVIPVIEGMPLKPIAATAYEQKVARLALDEAPGDDASRDESKAGAQK
ncbi:MAG: HlyD family efflux transporter periplasmic adaptor subunit [Planctomycetes bacterium]|nr:HlyD family efflux transporter periplasmic adaptor subunit [Planctomycetota bacterium]